MKVTWRWVVKFLAVSAALVLSAQLWLVITTVPTTKPTLTPVSAADFKVISPSTYKYILDQPAVCKNGRRRPFLVLMVPVSPADVESRAAVRKTWGASGLLPGRDILTVFFMGIMIPTAERFFQEHTQQRALEEESREHGDMIQMDFLDSYQNLTVKTMMMMHWLATHCQDASYAMKVDADIFVNVFYLVNKLLVGAPSRGYITGSVIRDGRPRRARDSKWYLSEELYAEDSFPPYVSGAGYVFSVDLAARISWASRFVRVIPLEDVYVGLCLRVLGVTPAYAQSFLALRNLFEVRRLEYDRCTYAQRVIVNGFKPSEMLDIWSDFSQGHLSC